MVPLDESCALHNLLRYGLFDTSSLGLIVWIRISFCPDRDCPSARTSCGDDLDHDSINEGPTEVVIVCIALMLAVSS